MLMPILINRKNLLLARAAIVFPLLLAGSVSSGPARAEVFPSKTVHIIVPIAPGGATDSLARVLADRLSRMWKRSVVVENKPGASAMIGTDYVAKAAPDGYTLLLSNDGPITINPALFRKSTFEPLNELTPVSNLASLPLVAVVHPSVPVKSIAELVTFAKANPGKLNFGSGGSTSRMGAELFKSMLSLDIVHVPYKGSGQMVSGLLANDVQMAFDGISSSLPLIKAGKLRALAVSGSVRHAQLPNLPTVDEAGVKGYQTTTWLGLFGPRNLPEDIRSKLAADFASALNEAEVRERVSGLGLEPVGSTPAQFVAQINAESGKWRELIRKTGITGEE